MKRARQTAFTYFEWFDYDKKKWARDDDLFYRICEDGDYDEISEEEANRIAELLKSVDAKNMFHEDLVKLVEG